VARLPNLWHTVEHVADQGRASGALKTAATKCEILVEDGIPYQLRMLVGAHLKKEAREEQDRTGVNPFLPPEPELVVGDLTASHFAVLNKFNVFGNHLLVVTREFVDQDELLDEGDFEALMVCMEGIDGLGFYNAGRGAGASQAHRHLQVTPLPMPPATGGFPMPMEAAICKGGAFPAGGQVVESGLPFPHARVHLSGDPLGAGAAGRLFDLYRELLDVLGLRGAHPLYNLLLTRRWMMVVPRSCERFEGISVNSLGFAGSLLARDPATLLRIKDVGPGAVLRAVAGSAN